MKTAPALLLVAACGGGVSTPLVGDVEITISGRTVVPAFGAALSTGEADLKLILLATRQITCASGDMVPEQGTYLSVQLNRVIGPQTSLIVVTQVDSTGANQIAGDNDVVVVEQFDDRVIAMVTFETDDPALGPITATGTFDVIACP